MNTQTNLPTVAVCIPCFNSERYLRTAIESVLAQTSPVDELLLSDNHSLDRTLSICQEYAGLPKVKIVRPFEHTSLGGNYRFLLEQATSDYLCFLSSDDALALDFVSSMRVVLAQYQDLAIIAGGCVETDSHLVPRSVRGSGLPGETLTPPDSFRYFATGCIYTISVALLSRRLLNETAALPKQADLPTDWYWSMMLGSKGRAAFLRKPLGYYRIHTTNSGHNNGIAWERSCAAMLPFLQSQLEPSLARELDSWVETLRVQKLEDEARSLRGETKPPEKLSLTKKLKDVVKRALASRYRTLPSALRLAEQGKSAALANPRGTFSELQSGAGQG